MSEKLLAQLQTGKLPKPAKLLAALRELCQQLNQDTDGTSFTPQIAAALAAFLPQLRDADNDSRKLVRLVHFFVTEIAARYAGAKDVVARLLEAVLDDLHVATYFPRQLIAIQSIGILSIHYYTQNALNVVIQQEKVYQVTLELVRQSNGDLQHLPFSLIRSGGGDASNKRKKDLTECLALSGALVLMIRHVIASTRNERCPPEWMAYLYTVCFATEGVGVHIDGARAGHAALLDLASKSESIRAEIAVHLSSNKMLLPCTAIQDALACISYLRLCACVAFSTTTGDSNDMREKFFRVLLEGALTEKRLRVTLEAITLLFQPLNQENMRTDFKRLIDVGAIARLLCHALQQTPLHSTTMHAILRATHLVARWLVYVHEEDVEHAAADLSLVMLATGGETHRVQTVLLKQLREMVLHMAGQLESRQLLSAALRQAVLRSLVWLVPSMPEPTLTSNNTNVMYGSCTAKLFSALSLSGTTSLSGTGRGGRAAVAAAIPSPPGTSPEAAMWQRFEKQLCEAPANLTDAQLARLLKEGIERLKVQAASPASAPTRLVLVPLLLSTAFNYVVAVPSDNISEVVFKVWESLLKLLSTQPAYQTKVLVAVCQTLDYAQCPSQGNGTDASSTADAASIVRHLHVWQAQGQPKAPTFAYRRAACIRMVRLACWFLGEHAFHFPSDRLGVIVFRLQTLGLFSDCFTRPMALQALCKIAVRCDSLDLKVRLYEYLHGLEKADFDIALEGRNPARKESRSKPPSGMAVAAVGETHLPQEQQQALLSSFDAHCGGVLNVRATLVHLRGVFRDELRSMGSDPPADGAAAAAVTDTSLFLVTEGQGN
ncbi:hypothetical protein VYU27_000763 [Nannochloropsis oceanica]